MTDRKPQVRDLTGSRHTRTPEFDWCDAMYVVKPDAFAKQHRRQMDHDLVEQIFTKALRRQVGSEDDDCLASGGLLRGRDGIADGSRNERDGGMELRVGRPMRQDEHRPLPLTSIDPVVAVELANGDVVPPLTAENCSSSMKTFVGDSAALHFDVARVLPVVAPIGDHPVHGIVPRGDEAIERHRHMPDHTVHALFWDLRLRQPRPH